MKAKELCTGTQRLTYTVDEVAKIIGVSRATVYEAVRRGELPAIHLGRRVVVPRAALRRILGEAED